MRSLCAVFVHTIGILATSLNQGAAAEEDTSHGPPPRDLRGGTVLAPAGQIQIAPAVRITPPPTPSPSPPPTPSPTCQGPSDWQYEAPDLGTLGTADILVLSSGHCRNSASSPGTCEDGTFVSAGYPLVEAVKDAENVYAANGQSTVILEVSGEIPGSQPHQFGGGDAGCKAYRAEWTNDPIDVAIVGKTGQGTDVINGFSIQVGLSGGASTPGVRKLRVENLTVRGQTWQNAVISSPQCLGPSEHGAYALLQVVGCRIEKTGTGVAKWGARLHGRTQFDFRNNDFEYVVEHAVYADSPQGDSAFISNTMAGSTRTMLQVVNRKNECGGNQPSGFGYLLVQDNVAQGIDNDGGSDFTVVGHDGAVIFRNNLSVDSTGSGSQGSIVVWTDAGKGIYYVDPPANQYSTKKVVIQDHIVNYPQADRGHIMLSGIETVEIRDDFAIAGNKVAFDFENSFGGPLGNGQICFDQPPLLSQYAGFQSFEKIRYQDAVVSDAVIDAYGLNNPCGPC